MMKNLNSKDSNNIERQVDSKQSGFGILIALLILVLGAAAWYGSTGSFHSEQMKSLKQTERVAELERVKERMLTYALLNPELFDEGATDLSIPGIGYFPCPDTSGDGNSDSGGNCTDVDSLYSVGWVPQRIANRNFSFLPSGQPLENKRYWFAVDTRFLVDSLKYRYGAALSPISTRFAPLNTQTPSLVDPTGGSLCDETPASAIPANCVPPLTLNGQGDIVMVLFYAGDSIGDSVREISPIKAAALDVNNYLEQPIASVPFGAETGSFISKQVGSGAFNDYVIAITREEWNAAMLSRVARDENADGIPDLCVLVDPSVTVKEKDSWFNECRYEGTVPPYPCLDATTLVARADAIEEPKLLWALDNTWSEFLKLSNVSSWFEGISVNWGGLLGMEGVLKACNCGMGGMGGMGGGGSPPPPPPSDPAIPNIEGQNWRTVLGCPP